MDFNHLDLEGVLSSLFLIVLDANIPPVALFHVIQYVCCAVGSVHHFYFCCWLDQRSFNIDNNSFFCVLLVGVLLEAGAW